MAVITVGAYSITTVTATLRGTFWDEPRANVYFEYKIGEGGSINRVFVGPKLPGTYDKPIVALNQNSKYYFRFGILIYLEWKWGFWSTFNTLNINVRTLEPEIIDTGRARGGVDWLEFAHFAWIQYKKGEEGAITRVGSYYKEHPPWWTNMYMNYPNSIYYCRGGIYFQSGVHKYDISGEWVMFHNAPYIYHYRAWAIGDDKLKHVGENKYFMPVF